MQYNHYVYILKHVFGTLSLCCTAIDVSVKAMWYRFSRREDDYCIECSKDEATFTNMEIIECQWHAHDGQAPDVEIQEDILK